MKKVIFILTLVWSFSVSAASEGWKNCDDEGTANCEYQIKDGVLTIRGTGENGAGTIPDYEQDCSYTRYPECVTPAPWKWDEDYNTIQEIIIKDGITSIGTDAFENMELVTHLEIPDTVTSIGQDAFVDLWSLENLTIPDTVTSIGDSAFLYMGHHNGVTVYCAESSPCLDRAGSYQLTTYEKQDGVYQLEDGRIFSSSNDMMKGENPCSDLDTCKAKVLNNKGICENIDKDCKDIVEAKNDGQYCDSFEACKTLVDMKDSGEYCDSIASCKALSDMAASGEYCTTVAECKALNDMVGGENCDSLESCKTLSDMASSGEYCTTVAECKALTDMANENQYCSTVAECKALNDMVGGENCDSLESCKALSDMASSGEYCTTVAECKRFKELLASGYCEGFAACKEMFNASVINYDGKRYGSLDDLYNGNALPSITRQEQGDGSFAVYKDGVFVGYKGKRIYTMEEANRVTKPTGNVFKIKYR